MLNAFRFDVNKYVAARNISFRRFLVFISCLSRQSYVLCLLGGCAINALKLLTNFAYDSVNEHLINRWIIVTLLEFLVDLSCNSNGRLTHFHINPHQIH